MKLQFDISALKQKLRLSSRAGEFVNPLRDWTIGFIAAVLVFVAGIAYAALDFYVQFGAPRTEVTIEQTPVQYREKEVLYHTELYRERERLFDELRRDRRFVPFVPQIVNDASDTFELETVPLANEGAGE